MFAPVLDWFRWRRPRSSRTESPTAGEERPQRAVADEEGRPQQADEEEQRVDEEDGFSRGTKRVKLDQQPLIQNAIVRRDKAVLATSSLDLEPRPYDWRGPSKSLFSNAIAIFEQGRTKQSLMSTIAAQEQARLTRQVRRKTQNFLLNVCVFFIFVLFYLI